MDTQRENKSDQSVPSDSQSIRSSQTGSELMMESPYQETPNEPLENSKNSEISVENTDDGSDVKNDGLSEISDNQKQNHELQESLVLNQDVSMATENMEVDRCSDELRTEEREESETYGDKKDNTSDNTQDVNDDNKSDGVLNPEMYVESTVEYDVSKPPVQICGAWAEFSQTDNFLRGCKWSPDGSCLMTCSNDCSLRLFNLPEPLLTGQTENLEEMISVLKIQESETVYDYSWYPLMSSADPATCCFATTSSNTPIHLWDAFTGELRCSYRAFNQVDEVTPAHCVSFSGDGSKLYCGFNKTVRVFNVDRPGRQCEQRLTYMKEGQAGIISCIASSPLDAGLYAAGSYSRSVALYYEPNGEMVCMFQGHQGGVTHIQFTPDGTKLLSGGRKDPEILCWDLRNPGQILFTAPRKVETNQRIYFDVDNSGRYLVSGNHDGTVSVWDMTRAPATLPDSQDPVLEPVLNYKAHNDTVNGASLHPSMPLLVTSSGQRHFSNLLDSDEEDTDPISNKVDNSVRLWYM